MKLTFPRYMYAKEGPAILVLTEGDAGGLSPLPPHKQVEVKPKRKR